VRKDSGRTACTVSVISAPQLPIQFVVFYQQKSIVFFFEKQKKTEKSIVKQDRPEISSMVKYASK
jgi:hypothetical protein